MNWLFKLSNISERFLALWHWVLSSCKNTVHHYQAGKQMVLESHWGCQCNRSVSLRLLHTVWRSPWFTVGSTTWSVSGFLFCTFNEPSPLNISQQFCVSSLYVWRTITFELGFTSEDHHRLVQPIPVSRFTAKLKPHSSVYLYDFRLLT